MLWKARRMPIRRMVENTMNKVAGKKYTQKPVEDKGAGQPVIGEDPIRRDAEARMNQTHGPCRDKRVHNACANHSIAHETPPVGAEM